MSKENAEEPQKHFTATRPQKPDFVFTAQRLAVDEELKMHSEYYEIDDYTSSRLNLAKKEIKFDLRLT